MNYEINKIEDLSLTLQDILELEERIGFTLPEDYKLFLLENNACKIKPDSFEIKGYEGSTTLQYFLGLKYSESYYNISEPIESESGEIIPDKIEIAEDFGGNKLLLTKGGKIEFWDHNNDNFYEVADNFTEFLNKLYA